MMIQNIGKVLFKGAVLVILKKDDFKLVINTFWGGYQRGRRPTLIKNNIVLRSNGCKLDKNELRLGITGKILILRG